jgi:hypothetical protein
MGGGGGVRRFLGPEDAIQHEIVKAIHRCDLFVFHIPNGGQRSMREGMRFKAIGVVAGIPDLFIPAILLWLEVKTAKGRLSPAQRKIHQTLTAIGHRVAVVRSVDEALKEIDDVAS